MPKPSSVRTSPVSRRCANAFWAVLAAMPNSALSSTMPLTRLTGG
ncbi:hypothetical protein [Streptomyces lanatus]|uniref:Uncharacterized protein n=1 Tax=Streptomyces lanatus TaxID=66900 RepID=A0ABV1XKH2_9ACTN|nr:hypothetical protein [Streptomyces lanatus]